jgi:hypothetical protein
MSKSLNARCIRRWEVEFKAAATRNSLLAQA